jgi:hypothetical protein
MRKKYAQEIEVISVQSLKENTYENHLFGDLYFFSIHHIPVKPSRYTLAAQLENSSYKITTDEGMTAWYEHDAIHYLSQQPFNENGEKCVKYLEQKLWRGWLPHGEEYNTWGPVECDYSHISQELITETAGLIQKYQESWKYDPTYDWTKRYVPTN